MLLNKALIALDRPGVSGRFLRFGFAATLGATGSLGQAPFDLTFVSLLAFVAGFALLEGQKSTSAAAWFGWAFGLGYFALGLQWLVSHFMVEPERHGWMAPFALFFMAGGLALFWSLAFGLARRLGSAAVLVLTLPLVELVRAYLFTGFPWGMPSYGLVNTWLAGGASWIGSHGLNLMFLGLAYCAWAAFRGREHMRFALGILAGVGIVALLLPPVHQAIPKTAPIVRLVQPNAPQHQKWDPDFRRGFFERALSLTAAGDIRPDLILWPETSLPDMLNYADTALDLMSEAAGDVPIVVGANRLEGVRLMNAAVLLDGAGAVQQIYDKRHLVPFGEYVPFGEVLAGFGIHGLAASEGMGFTAGSDAAPKQMDLGALGKALLLICYEAVFPQDVGAYETRPDFLLQITNDAWFGNFSGPFQHLAQARMRAIEQGLPFVRAANTGVSAMIDAHGQVTEALPLNKAGYLDVALPPPLAKTFYAQTGDIPLFMILLLGFLGLWVRKRRESN